MDIENDLNRALKPRAEVPTQLEAGCTKMVQRLLELGPPKTVVRQLGPYRLLEQIGEGGMGEVWRAHHEKLDRIVAIKRLKPQVIQSDELKLRFEREMRIAGNLDHPNIVSITHADEVDGVHYLAMEFVEGQTLSDVLQAATASGQQLSVEAVCDYARQIAAGLQFAHENGIVHRDIKPANVMVTNDGQVKILDMGLARFAHKETPVSEITSEHQTMGTLDYMPPEQLRDSRTAGAGADIYALGCTLYKLLAGRAPFADDRTSTAEAKIMAIAGEVPESVVSLRPNVPSDLSELIDQMLLKEPQQRPESMAAILTRPGLSIPEERVDAQPIPASGNWNSNRRNRSRTLWIAGGFFGLVLLLCGVVIQLSDPVRGNLKIQAPDGVTIRATRVDDPSETYEFTGGHAAAELKVGAWKITIVGEGFDEFIVDGSDVVKISGREGAVVKLTRSRPAVDPSKGDTAIVASDMSERPAANSVETTDSFALRRMENRPTDEELLARLDRVDWKPGEPHQLVAGEVSNPAPIDGLPNWQLGSTFPVGGVLVGVSPKGTYLLVAVQGGSEYYIYQRSNGRLHGVIQTMPRHSAAFSWNPNEEEVLVQDGNPARVRIFSPDGRYLRNFSNDDDWAGKSLHWSPDGERILVASADALNMLTPDGITIDSFIPPKGGGRGFQRSNVWSPDGSMFACQDGKHIRVYKRDGGEPIYEAECDGHNGFLWRPESHSLVHRQVVDNASVAVLWTIDGQSRVLSQIPGTGFIRFSPDGHFFITDNGSVYELDGQKVADVPMPFDFGMSGNLIRWDEPGKITIFSKIEPGSYVEYSPSGKQLHSGARPVPLPVVSANWLKDENKIVSVFPAPYAYRFRKKWWMEWSERGEGQSHQLDDEDAWRESSAVQIGWNSADNFFSINTFDGVRIFDLAGKQISHLEQGEDCQQEAWSPDGKRLAISLYSKGGVVIYEGGNRQRYLEGEEGHPALQWTADSKRLIVSFGRKESYHQSPDAVLHHAVISADDGRVSELTSKCAIPLSPSGKWTTIVTKSSVAFSADGETSRNIKFDQPVSFNWWTCRWNSDESQVLILGADSHTSWLYNFATDTLKRLPKTHSKIDAMWSRESLLAVGGNSSLSLWPRSDQPSMSIALPTRHMFTNFANGRRNPISMCDGVPLSNDGRYASVILNTGAHFDQGGNLCVVDLHEKQVAWTGIAFNDGKRAVVENTGRVREVDGEYFDDYLTYTISHPAENPMKTGHRVVPLTRLQFASRIGLTKPQQAIQTVLDIDGTLLVGEEKQAVVAADFADARELPAVDDVVGVELNYLSCVTEDVFSQLVQLKQLRSLKLRLWRLGPAKMTSISHLPKLNMLDLSETELPDRAASLLPESLQELDVSNTNIGNFFLLDLPRFKSLRKLNISNTEVTADAVARLQMDLPDCVITCDYSKEVPKFSAE